MRRAKTRVVEGMRNDVKVGEIVVGDKDKVHG